MNDEQYEQPIKNEPYGFDDETNSRYNRLKAYIIARRTIHIQKNSTQKY